MMAMNLVGCAEIDVPSPGRMIKDPLSGGLTRGMSKSQVMNIYGQPGVKRTVESADWGATREEWYYNAKYTGLPVGAGYLTEDLYLYFDGDSLTNISKTPIGTSSTADQDDTQQIK
ncbi:MAG: outer membrane protein assembly factor BamE [Candidatus Omnitrophica bacterium]|nr:outer membrane protein assembly factor BamE [Candidatus Omnitrophota bacterium]